MDRGTVGEIGLGLELPLAHTRENDTDRLRPTGHWAGVAVEAPSVLMQPASGSEHGGIGAHGEGIGGLRITSNVYARAFVGISGGRVGSGGASEYVNGGLEGQLFSDTGWSMAVGASYARGATTSGDVHESWHAPIGSVKLFYTPLVVKIFDKLGAFR